uniref:Uncharacterized protein n=1 Tax=Glossina brevipalpis TaxID=37001 RepID=A0A1A9WUJ9_9MUSC
MSEEADIPTFKCVLVGDGDTGKTTFVERQMTSEFEKRDNTALSCLTSSHARPYKNEPNWHSDLVRVFENIRIVLCGNKIDINDRKVKAKSIVFHRKNTFSTLISPPSRIIILRSPSYG